MLLWVEVELDYYPVFREVTVVLTFDHQHLISPSLSPWMFVQSLRKFPQEVLEILCLQYWGGHAFREFSVTLTFDYQSLISSKSKWTFRPNSE